jgi:hypothetical protein
MSNAEECQGRSNFAALLGNAMIEDCHRHRFFERDFEQLNCLARIWIQEYIVDRIICQSFQHDEHQMSYLTMTYLHMLTRTLRDVGLFRRQMTYFLLRERDTLCFSLTCEMDNSWQRSASRAASAVASRSSMVTSLLWVMFSDDKD